MDEERRVTQHVTTLVTMAMRGMAESVPHTDQPTLDGLHSPLEEAQAALVQYFCAALREYRRDAERPAHFLARVAVGAAIWLHRTLCRNRRPRRTSSCPHDAQVVSKVVQGLALSVLDLDLHQDTGGLISDAANAHDLGEVQRVDGLAAKFAELLHPHGNRRSVLEVTTGSPIIQFNSPIRHVDGALYSRNRAAALDLLPTAEAHGLRVDVTSDYAAPGRPATRQEYLVRSGVLRAAAIMFQMNGAGPGTGRAIELAAAAMTPVLLLRRVSTHDPAPLNPDRHSGEVTGIAELLYETAEQAQELLRGFLSSEQTSITARQRTLVALEDGEVPEEAWLVHAADDSAFVGSRISKTEAEFWVEPLHWPFAGPARQAAVRRAVGLRPDVRATGGPAAAPRPERRRDDRQSMLTLIAYGKMTNLSVERTLRLWDARYVAGPTTVRRDPPQEVEDWAELDRRTSR